MTSSALHDKMVELVKRMLDLHKQLLKAKTPHVWADDSQLTAYSLRPLDSEPSAVSRKPLADTDGSRPTAHSPRPSNSEPSAVSRKPMAAPDGQVYEQFLGKVIRLTPSHQAKVEERAEVGNAVGIRTCA